MSAIEQTLRQGLEHHRAGRLAEAESAYRAALVQHPNHPAGLMLLGTLAGETGHYEDAVMMLSHAARGGLDTAEVQASLGHALHGLNRLPEAIVAYRRALAMQPRWPAVSNNLGQALQTLDRPVEAEQALRAAVEMQPDFAEAWNNLAEVLRMQHRLEESIDAARKAIAHKPGLPQPHDILGSVLHALGRFEEAVAAHRDAVRLQPAFSGAWNNLGLALSSAGRGDEAVEAYETALRVNPNNAGAHLNLGLAMMSRGRVDEAVASYRKALSLEPNLAQAHSNLGVALREQGLIDEGIASMRTAARLWPAFVYAHSNVLFSLLFHPEVSAEETLAEHRAWAKAHADPLTAVAQGHSVKRGEERKLRVGFVSADLHDHPVGRFVLPVFEHHDRARFEFVCYSAGKRSDAVSAKLRAACKGWLDVLALSDEALAERVRADKVDVLIDLSAHSAAHRLMAFARKPAPVQISYMGYPGTTGMRAMDYRLSDPYLDPAGAESLYAEQTIRLPRNYWCFSPPADAPDVSSLPMRQAGRVTFGCLHQFGKMSSAALDAWTEVLKRTVGARLVLHSFEGAHRGRVLARFAQAGIDAARVEFVGRTSYRDYLSTYGRIDVTLDPFPYTGGTTTCEALWMGVPVVTLAGRSATGRAGVSILSNLGLTELIAEDVRAYAEIASSLAQDADRMAQLRATMRERMLSSAMMDGPGYTRDFENAILQAWRGDA